MRYERFRKPLLVPALITYLLSDGILSAAPLTWFPGKELVEPRSSAVSAVSPNGDILLFGGNPLGSTDVLRYGGSNAQAIPSTRVGPGAVAINASLYFVYGGRRTNAANSVSGSTLSYNPVSSGLDDPNVFTVASMKTARYDLGYAADLAGYAYAIGGIGNNNTVLSSVERYDSISNVWINVAGLPSARYLCPAVFDGVDTIYLFGGRTNAAAGGEIDTVLGYSVSGDAWSTVASMPIATAGSAAVAGADGKFYVLGGMAGGQATNLVQVYDAAANQWSISTSLPSAITGAAAAVDALGRVVVMGGADASGSDLTATWVSQQLAQPDAAPVFPTTTPSTAVYQVPYAYTNTASGNPQPVYELITGPDGLQVDPYTGILTWIPQANQVGSNLVTIQATNFAGTATRTFLIDAIGPAPATPVNVAVTDLQENSVSLAWDPVTPVIGSVTYRLYYRYVRYAGKGITRAYYAVLADNIPSPSVTINGLAANSSHTYAVTAVAAGAESALSANVSFTTLSPQPPTNLQLLGLTSTTVTLAWDPPAGPVPATSYEVWGWINNGVTSAVYANGVTNTTLTIGGLTPGVAREWGVRSHDVEGNVSAFAFLAGGQSFVNPVPQPAVLSGLSSAVAGGIQFAVQNTWPQTTLIQATTDPSDPSSWSTISTSPPTNASFLFIDTQAGLLPQRFYRAVNQ